MENIIAEAYQLWIEDGGSFERVYPLFPELTKPAVRGKLYRYKDRAPAPVIEEDPEVHEDPAEIWRRAVEVSKRVFRNDRRRRQLTFAHGPVTLVFMADLHLGGAGVDYAAIERDVDAILNTPATYIFLVGDVIDNFIMGRLTQLRVDGTPFRVTEEWSLVRHFLTMAAPRIVGSVSGNHDEWTRKLSGIDYLAEVHAQLNEQIMYARDGMAFDLTCGRATWRVKARHKWQRNSIYNPTHGIERAAELEKFDVGVGAHTHRGAYAREFNRGDGKTGIAIQVGTYKVSDDFARTQGFAAPNGRQAVALVVDDAGAAFATSDLKAAARFMSTVYGETDPEQA